MHAFDCVVANAHQIRNFWGWEHTNKRMDHFNALLEGCEGAGQTTATSCNIQNLLLQRFDHFQTRCN